MARLQRKEVVAREEHFHASRALDESGELCQRVTARRRHKPPAPAHVRSHECHVVHGWDRSALARFKAGVNGRRMARIQRDVVACGDHS